MTTEREALDQIAALCDWWDDGETDGELVPIHRVRAILAAVTPETGVTLDRAQARDALATYYRVSVPDAILDALALCVRPAAIDRDALLDLMEEHIDGVIRRGKGPFADAILALVRPVAGVVLSPEERALLAETARKWANAQEQAAAAAALTDDQFDQVFSDKPERLRALADRLETQRND